MAVVGLLEDMILGLHFLLFSFGVEWWHGIPPLRSFLHGDVLMPHALLLWTLKIKDLLFQCRTPARGPTF